MTDNPSLVLRKIEDLTYEQRPIPEGQESLSLPQRHLTG